VQNVGLSWQQAGVLAGALFATAGGLHLADTARTRRIIPYAREAGIVAGLYALWQLAGTLSVLGSSGAFQRARWIERFEHDLWLPSERSVQQTVVGHPLLVQAANLYYASMHFGVLFVFLFWVFLRHRDAYPRVRLTLVLVTAACLLVELVPVAPPRMLPGYVDTAARYGQSVYSLGIAPDQLSAMPSVHVAWAMLVGWTVYRLGSGGWRWLGWVHAAVTVYVVAATANHFWLDGIVASALLVASLAAQRAARAALRRRRAYGAARTTAAAPALADAAV
jgi:hypothetical protein